MPKNIVFCADGTWNSPNADDNKDQIPDPTNVYKLFISLAGSLAVDSIRSADEQEKSLEVAGTTQQIAKYIHGVGDSRNAIRKLMGGAFGAGVISRVVRGYTFISRNYEPGAEITIVGFSRGAYTARALAGLIASQGLLSTKVTPDKETAYRRGAEAWYRYRKAAKTKTFSLATLAEIAADLPAFLTQITLKDKDLVPVDHIRAVAVWDTVGAMGLPRYISQDERADAFKFADLKLSASVQQGFHAVALDERRVDFSPTLWDAATNVTQMLFPGAHCDVGGGYPTLNNESGLSDIGLQWMIEQLSKLGVLFSNTQAYPIKPDALGVAHNPSAHVPWNIPGIPLGARKFPKNLLQHPAIAARMAASKVIADPGTEAAPYKPGNLP